MNPTLIPYREFQEEYLLNAFNDYTLLRVHELLRIYFILNDKLDQKEQLLREPKPRTEEGEKSES